MDLADLIDDLMGALNDRQYDYYSIDGDSRTVTVFFVRPADAQMLAGSLLSCGIPRRYANNLINGTVSFETAYLDRVVQLLGDSIL